MHGCGSHRGHGRRVDVVKPSSRAEPLVPVDDLRASDAERERIVLHLRDHAGEGRLTVDELDERIEQVYAARTRRELAALTDDLPRPRRSPAVAAARARDEFADHLRTYLMVMALLVGIWAVSGAGYFWPVWPMLGWGIGVASHWSATRGPRRRAQLGAPRG